MTIPSEFGSSYNAIADELRQRGVQFPLGGFSPGLYSVVCRSCARRFEGDKRAMQCLPCALAKAVAADRNVEAARRDGEVQGYRKAVSDLIEGERRRYDTGDEIVIETVIGVGGMKTGRA
ncbi:hypothetical protein [Jiella sp. M17.18]|uniref:hypothetical protein n=1 Tax=Jiella sp. M17.18 TaxID=3234247 RepID=UPI0034DF527E